MKSPKPGFVIGTVLTLGFLGQAFANESQWRTAQLLFNQGQYFKSARYAFTAGKEDKAISAQAYALMSRSLVKSGLLQSASYFFIRTLQSGDASAIKNVLLDVEVLLDSLGVDLLRPFLLAHTHISDYSESGKNAYLYALAKSELMASHTQEAIDLVSGVSRAHFLFPHAMQIRATAFSILLKSEAAISDFKVCASDAQSWRSNPPSERRKKSWQREYEDLRDRCLAGYARVLYETERFEEAELAYDQISKRSLVWPDILFEQAWNSFATGQFNRTLGKLVSYKSPALRGYFQPEVEVLRAQTYMNLCLYDDTNEVINQFNEKFSKIGAEVKQLVESKATDLKYFFSLGTQSLKEDFSKSTLLSQWVSRFARSPYFVSLAQSVDKVESERMAIKYFDRSQPGVSHQMNEGFPGFLNQVLDWRKNTVYFLGGALIKNSLIDHHSILVSDFEKMAFIKLEMLSRSKSVLQHKKMDLTDRSRGMSRPSRRDDQYYFMFNGEFWIDELGDYVFGLESECKNEHQNP